jgi:N-acetylglucosamine kinase-like BadF-type ATPase
VSDAKGTRVLLALDGGGSKIDVALVDRRGRVLGAVRWPASIYEGMDGGGSLGGIAGAVKAVCHDAGINTEDRPVADLGVYCVAGADFPADDRRIERLLSRQGFTRNNLVRNDTFAVLRSGTDLGWGVAVVCGSGINCTGIAPDGRTVRFPALGLVSGDLSDGHLIGVNALGAAIRAVDGRGPRTSLERMVPHHFGMRGPMQVLKAIHFGRLDERRLIELPPVVFAAARQGDAVAHELIDRQADEVVAMAGAAIRRLRLTRHPVDVVLGGGILRNDGPFMDRIRGGILAVAPRARIVVLSSPPVVGAALMGLDQLRASSEAKERVRDSLTDGRVLRED